MKKTKFILGVVAATAMVAMTMTGCDGLTLNNESERSSITGYAVKSITLDTTEVAKEFVINTDFSYTGLKVTATYVDDSTADVSKDVSVTAPDTKTTGTKTVTVSYGKTSLGKDCTAVKATYDIEVTLKVTSIALKDGVTIYTYNNKKNKVLYASDAEFIATYSDTSTKDIPLSNNATFGDVSNGKVTFTYAGVTSDEITVTNSTDVSNLLAADVSVSNLLAAGAKVGEFPSSYVTYYAALDGTDADVTIVGSGSYVEDATFTKVFKNDGAEIRTSYLLLPEDTLQHSSESKKMTIGFWVNNTTTDTGVYHPLFSAYAAKATENSWPMFILQSRALAQVNCGGYCDFAAAQNDNSTNYESIDWLGEQNTWHYYTAVLTETTLKIYADGVLLNSWTIDGTTEGQVLAGMFTSTELKYVCLGGNQAWSWADNDAPYSFAQFSVWNTALSQEDIANIYKNK